MTQGEKLKVYRGARLVGELDMSDGESFYGFTYAESYLAILQLFPCRLAYRFRADVFWGLLPCRSSRGCCRKAMPAPLSPGSSMPLRTTRHSCCAF